jgi:hypothetical protein
MPNVHTTFTGPTAEHYPIKCTSSSERKNCPAVSTSTEHKPSHRRNQAAFYNLHFFHYTNATRPDNIHLNIKMAIFMLCFVQSKDSQFPGNL